LSCPCRKITRIERVVDEGGFLKVFRPHLSEDAPFLTDQLSLPASKRHPLPNLSPQRKKERTLEALIRQFQGLAPFGPMIMLFEDEHWIDPTSVELLDLWFSGAANCQCC
jgi:predicted ATPase